MESVKHLILGHGLTGEYLSAELMEQEPNASVVSTSRKGSPHIEFDLENEATWSQLPEAEITYWTFPPEPTDLVKKFYNQYQQKLGKLIVIGSTSALKVDQAGQVVDENTDLDTSIERVASEVFLKEQGAILLLSAGIYGPERSPLDWVKKGYLGKSKKWANMVHLEDLAGFLYACALRGQSGALYIACNNNPQPWDEVITDWEQRGLVQNVPEKESKRTSKKINNSKTIKDLQVNLQFQNFASSVS